MLAFPAYDFGFLAWIGMIPLLIALNGKSCLKGFCLAQVCGMLVMMGAFQWILEVEKYTILHHVLLTLYFGAYFGLFGLIFCFISKRKGSTAAFLSAPFIWVSLEYLKSHMSFMALPWILLGHSQYRYSAVIQISAITGTFGVSFLIVMANSALAWGISELFSASGISLKNINPNGIRKIGIVLMPAIFLVAAVLIYGHTRLAESISGKKVKVAVVQGNIDPSIKWDPKYSGSIMKIYTDLTRQSITDKPDLVVWPESATPGSVTRHQNLSIMIAALARQVSALIIFGSTMQGKFKQNNTIKLKYHNSAFLISQTSIPKENNRYNKIRLLPFGEYLPYKDTIPWSWLGISKVGDFVPGDRLTVFRLPGFRFGVTICWEDIFPGLVRQLVQNGAQLIINITNEAWFGETAAPYQFLSMSVFRAVENRVFVVRCANTGISCFIDPAGRIVSRVTGLNGQDIFVRGVLTGTVIPLDSKTLYNRFGDWLVWLSILISLFFLLSAMRGKQP